MVERYKPPVDYRTTAARTPSPEPIDIDSSGYALLAEAPANPADPTTPMVVTVGGQARARVASAPAAGQFCVLTATVLDSGGTPRTEWTPVLQFNTADASASGTADYYRTGTITTAAWFAALRAWLTPLIGYVDSALLPAATTDPNLRGFPGDTAILTDGTMYWSDGYSWQPIAGSGSAVPTRSLTLVQTIATAFGAGYAGVVDVAVALGLVTDTDRLLLGSGSGDVAIAGALASATGALWNPVTDDPFAVGLASAFDVVWSPAALSWVVDDQLAVSFGTGLDAAYSSGGATSVSDDFNRANGGLGANWTTAPSAVAPQIVTSNAFTGSGAVSSAYWSANAFAANQFSRARIGVVQVGTPASGPTARQSASEDTCYFVDVRDSSDLEQGTYTGRLVTLYKLVAGVRTQLSQVDSPGDESYFELRAVGTTISVHKSQTQATWSQVLTVTDAAIAAGAAGIRFENNNTAEIISWWAGDL